VEEWKRALGEWASGSGDGSRLHSQEWLCHKSYEEGGVKEGKGVTQEHSQE